MRRELPDDSELSRRSRLAQFGLSFDKQETTVANLSGGERARLLLNLVAMAAPHLLILDEPTNHLDIDSRRALLDALNDYEGAVILITHDRSLIELVADRLWLTADGHDRAVRGDMDDYARFVLDRARARASPSQHANRATRPKLARRCGASGQQAARGPPRGQESRQEAKTPGALGRLSRGFRRIDRPPTVGKVQVASAGLSLYKAPNLTRGPWPQKPSGVSANRPGSSVRGGSTGE